MDSFKTFENNIRGKYLCDFGYPSQVLKSKCWDCELDVPRSPWFLLRASSGISVNEDFVQRHLKMLRPRFLVRKNAMEPVDFLEQATRLGLPAIIELKTDSARSKHSSISKGAIEIINELKSRIDSLLDYIDDLCETGPLDTFKNSTFLARRSGKSLITVFNCFHKNSTGVACIHKLLSHHRRYNEKSLIVKVFIIS